jgi:hypothetical protein
MTAETWSTLIVSVVVPLVLRIVTHYWPWLADDAPPRHARGGADDA